MNRDDLLLRNNLAEYRDQQLDTRPSIILLASSLGIGGAERHMVALARLLSDRFRVLLAYLKPSCHGGAELAVEADERVELHSLNVQSRIDIQSAKELAALMLRHRCQLILCANSFALMYAQIARAILKRKIIVVEVFHSTKPATFREHLEMAFYRPFFWAADHLVYLSEAQRRYWTQRGLWARETHVIHNGIDCDYFCPAASTSEVEALRAVYGFGPADRVVGICAILRPEKAHSDLLHAVSLLRNEGSAWKVLIIGDGPMRPAIEAEIAGLGLGDSVAFTGLQSDVRQSVSVCDILTLVSRTETFSIAALESMSMAKPMIMSNIGGASEQVTHGYNGLLFPAGHVQALAECLRTCADPAIVRQMGRRARERVLSEFTQRAMGQRYVELLEKAVSL